MQIRFLGEIIPFLLKMESKIYFKPSEKLVFLFCFVVFLFDIIESKRCGILENGAKKLMSYVRRHRKYVS